MDNTERIALQFLNKNLRNTIINTVAVYNKPINEIRLRANKRVFLTIGRENVRTDYTCTADDLAYTSSALCKGSLYSYSEDIKEGVITTDQGIRAGVCGRAVVKNGRIHCVRDISSINIRIPHRVNGAGDALYELVRDHGSVLVYSIPGLGKTTALRELIPKLSSGKEPKRVSVIDTRFELTALLEAAESVDVFLGYPRREGIVAAIRTMSPEFIVCDEISSSDDAEAILLAYSAGVKVVVSTHADNYNGLIANKNIHALIETGVFSALYEIRENGFEIKMVNERDYL